MDYILSAEHIKKIYDGNAVMYEIVEVEDDSFRLPNVQ